MVCLTDEPVVLAVKLADRLHNMRTCHALAPDKRAAVAWETLEVWCSLAEQLGMFPLKVRHHDADQSRDLHFWALGGLMLPGQAAWHLPLKVRVSSSAKHCAPLADPVRQVSSRAAG